MKETPRNPERIVTSSPDNRCLRKPLFPSAPTKPGFPGPSLLQSVIAQWARSALSSFFQFFNAIIIIQMKKQNSAKLSHLLESSRAELGGQMFLCAVLPPHADPTCRLCHLPSNALCAENKFHLGIPVAAFPVCVCF